MGDSIESHYWCHICSQIVNPLMDLEIKCPLCMNGFVEELTPRDEHETDSEFGLDHALSLWAPILLGLMGNSRHRRRLRRIAFEDEEEEEEEQDDDTDHDESRIRGGHALSREIDLPLGRRRRTSTAIWHLLRALRASEDRGRERDPILFLESLDSLGNELQSQENVGDYLVRSGLDALLHHLAENDPNRYGTPPAKREAVEALPTITIHKASQCAVCLEDFVVGSKATQMPCSHCFHVDCILPWLDLHSSCPVCRHLLPGDNDDSKPDLERRDDAISTAIVSEGRPDMENGGERWGWNGRRFSFPWSFGSLFSSSRGSEENVVSPSSSSSSSSLNAHGNHAREE